MGLTIKVNCNRCGYFMPVVWGKHIPSLDEINEVATKHGWLAIGFNFYCPLCRAKYEDTDDLCTAEQALKERERSD